MLSRKPIWALALMLTAAATAATATTTADWRELISPGDAGRILALEDSRDRGIAALRQGEGRGSFDAIKNTIEPGGRSIPANALPGYWHCRQMKLGGVAPWIVYDWYSCRVSVTRGGGLFLEKLNGSQRTAGFLYPENGAWVYLDASSVAGEPMHRYSGNGASVGASVTPDDQVGLLTGIGNNHLRLEIPATQESLLDVIELAR